MGSGLGVRPMETKWPSALPGLPLSSLLPPSRGAGGRVRAQHSCGCPPPTPLSPVAPGNPSWPAVEQPIPALEGNVYFLLQIAPAAAWWLNEPFELGEAPIVGSTAEGAKGWGMEGWGLRHCVLVTRARGSKGTKGIRRSGGGS